MANPEHVEILKQGVDVWNRWREENPEVRPDLKEEDLRGKDLFGINLSGAILIRTNFTKSTLEKANFYKAELQEAVLQNANLVQAVLEQANLNKALLQEGNLEGANLTDATLIESYLWKAVIKSSILKGANLEGADLRMTELQHANINSGKLNGSKLNGADLFKANLEGADLLGANLSGAKLLGARLLGANLFGAKLEGAILRENELGGTQFDDLDLSKTIGLETCIHYRSSTIGTNTLVQSKGQIPTEFLRGCGLSNWEIESAKLYQPNLSNQEIIDINYRIIDIRMTQAIQINPLFISYSHADAAFVDKIGEALTEKGVRYWRDIRDAKAGKLEKQVDQAMRLNPIVLIVLSETSSNSDWVEFEAGKARKLEKELKRDVLCPVAIDDSWKDCDWPGRLRTQIENYNILPFNGWEDQAVFDRMFAKLLGGLDLFYKK